MEIPNESYTLLKTLGSGGMSTVYLAEHRRLHTRVAIKQIPRDKLRDAGSEYRLLQKLRHPMLPYVLDAFADDGYEYIVEEYIPGETLQQRLERSGPVDEATACVWMKALCQVLAYLHSRTPAILYRDLKPANIMVQPDGSLKLLDFGIARETAETAASSTHAGSCGYAAPEQFGHGPVDARTDVYGLGMTFHHLLTGKSPFDPPYTIRPVRELNPGISVGMEYVVRRCTQADPARRYKSVQSLLYDLDHLYLFEDRYKRYRRRIRSRRAVVAALLVCGASLAGAGGWQMARQALAVVSAPQADAYHTGLQLLEQNRCREAAEALTAALETAENSDRQAVYLARGDAYYQEAQQETQAEPALALLDLALQDYTLAGAADKQQAAQQLQQSWQAEQESLDILADVYALFAAGDSEAVFDFMEQDAFYTCRGGMRGDSLTYTSPDGTKGVTVYRSDAMIYYGDLVDGLREGEGMLLAPVQSAGNPLDYLYVGSWAHDKPNGTGSVSVRNFYTGTGVYVGALHYSGHFVDGLLDGDIQFSMVLMERTSEEADGTMTVSQVTGMRAEQGILQPLPDGALPAWYDPQGVPEGSIPIGYDEQAHRMYHIAADQADKKHGALPFAGVLALA